MPTNNKLGVAKVLNKEIPTLGELVARSIINSVASKENKEFQDELFQHNLQVLKNSATYSLRLKEIMDKVVKDRAQAEKLILQIINSFPPELQGNPPLVWTLHEININKTISAWLNTVATAQNLHLNDYQCVRWAMSVGDVALCQFLLDLATPEDRKIIIDSFFVENNPVYGYMKCVFEGHTELGKWGLNLLNREQREIKINQLTQKDNLIRVMRDQHEVLFKWLLSLASPDIKV